MSRLPARWRFRLRTWPRRTWHRLLVALRLRKPVVFDLDALMAGRCRHEGTVVPVDADWARCTACGDDSFPLSDRAAGRWPCCGAYADHHPGCPAEARHG